MTTDIRHSYRESIGELSLHTEQEITSEYIDKARADYDASLDPMKGELQRVATVPAQLVELWLSQGFDAYRAGGKAIIKRLREQGLDYFITTKRSL